MDKEKGMKVRDVVKDAPVWKELFQLVTELLDAGKQAHDGGLYMAGLRLSRIITYLADIDIPGEQLPEDQLKELAEILAEDLPLDLDALRKAYRIEKMKEKKERKAC